MAANNSIVADAVLEDKLADLWPDYPCLYDVQCPEFKNRELRDKAFQKLAEKHGKATTWTMSVKKINLQFTYESRNTLKSLSLFLTAKTISKLNMQQNVKLDIEI